MVMILGVLFAVLFIAGLLTNRVFPPLMRFIDSLPDYAVKEVTEDET